MLPPTLAFTHAVVAMRTAPPLPQNAELWQRSNYGQHFFFLGARRETTNGDKEQLVFLDGSSVHRSSVTHPFKVT